MLLIFACISPPRNKYCTGYTKQRRVAMQWLARAAISTPHFVRVAWIVNRELARQPNGKSEWGELRGFGLHDVTLTKE